jgi:hypothetical protein
MFANYSIAATHNNWIHETIEHTFLVICESLNNGDEPPAWPEILPDGYRVELQDKEKLPDLIDIFVAIARKLNKIQRDNFIDIFNKQNHIDALLDGTGDIPSVPAKLKKLVKAAKDICYEGFSLLTKTGVRDAHYLVIWNSLSNKRCPFCGYEDFESPKLQREDEDHYLARKYYPLAAANLKNLVPMGGKCNRLYKGQKNVLVVNGHRRIALNPYGNVIGDISLMNTNPIGSPSLTPDWKLDLLPDIDVIRTWENVFSIKSRLMENKLIPIYENWLDDLTDWFKIRKLNETIDDNYLFDEIHEFGLYNKKPKHGPIYFETKISEMLEHHCRNGNIDLIAMIRSGLPKQTIAA